MEKGECFKNVYQYAMDHESPNLVVVHGKVNKRDGTPVDHAWLEDGDTVIEPTFVIAQIPDMKWNKEVYYAKLHAVPEAKYNAMDAIGLTVRARNYGPWTTDEQRGKNMLHEEKETTKIDPIQLKIGTEVETEHTDGDRKEAKKIATDHLKEKGEKHKEYYTHLNKAGLINEPEAKKLVKKYLMNERQLRLIGENIMVEEPSQFEKGDMIKLLAPVEGYPMPEGAGEVVHVDALGMVRAVFNIGGTPTIIPINPKTDQVKISWDGLGTVNEHYTNDAGYSLESAQRHYGMLVPWELDQKDLNLIKRLRAQAFKERETFYTNYDKYKIEQQLSDWWDRHMLEVKTQLMRAASR